MIALNSNIEVEAGSAQARWLKQELAEHPSQCTVAIWHHPRFSSGKHGDSRAMADIWRELYDAGIDVVISAHDHDYERFAPLGPTGELEPERGIRQFVVGTGGAALRPFENTAVNSEARNARSFGVLSLTPSEGSYAWEFMPAGDSGYRDQGRGSCHR